MPNAETYTIKHAGHACYDDRVLEFHLILYEFAKKMFNVHEWSIKGKIKIVSETCDKNAVCYSFAEVNLPQWGCKAQWQRQHQFISFYFFFSFFFFCFGVGRGREARKKNRGKSVKNAYKVCKNLSFWCWNCVKFELVLIYLKLFGVGVRIGMPRFIWHCHW